MSPESSRTPRTTTAIRFREELHARLVTVSDDRDVSINRIVNRAVELYLASLDHSEGVLP